MFRKCALVLTILLFIGCSRTMLVSVPPAVDLEPYGNIGLISFSTENAKGHLDEMATQRFLQAITQFQRGAQLIELGPLDEVLSRVNKPTIDQEAVKAIGKQFNVKGVFVGKISISDVKPQVSISALIKSMGVRASFTISMTSRLYSTSTGATSWTDSVRWKDSLANLSLSEGGIPSFNVRDQDEAYATLIENMIYELTRDFRPTQRRVKRPKY
ncbi:MAG: hypothetical protein PVF66_00190 [Candidatus Aminicenantes bacterium]|jgi:hypothetical protein